MDREKMIYAWIFARGGSKGLPGKNIRLLGGKPLIAYAIETAKKSRYIKEVFVSTDSADIAAIAEQYGAVVPFCDQLSCHQIQPMNAWHGVMLLIGCVLKISMSLWIY